MQSIKEKYNKVQQKSRHKSVAMYREKKKVQELAVASNKRKYTGDDGTHTLVKKLCKLR